MSLEAAITKLNTNIEALIATLGNKPAFDVEAATADAKAKTQAAFDKRVKKPEAPAVAEQSTAEVKPAESTAETPTAAPASAPIDYQKDVVPKALAVAKKLERAGLRTLLDQFGVPADKTAQALKPEQYADFIAACDKALA